MRIDLQYQPQDVRQREASGAQRVAAAGAETADQARVGSDHIELQALTAQAWGLPEVRAERVEHLREAMRSGSYRVDAGKLADAMMSEMLGRSTG